MPMRMGDEGLRSFHFLSASRDGTTSSPLSASAGRLMHRGADPARAPCEFRRTCTPSPAPWTLTLRSRFGHQEASDRPSDHRTLEVATDPKQASSEGLQSRQRSSPASNGVSVCWSQTIDQHRKEIPSLRAPLCRADAAICAFSKAF